MRVTDKDDGIFRQKLGASFERYSSLVVVVVVVVMVVSLAFALSGHCVDEQLRRVMSCP